MAFGEGRSRKNRTAPEFHVFEMEDALNGKILKISSFTVFLGQEK